MTDEPADAGQVVDPDEPRLTADERAVFKEGFETDPTKAAFDSTSR